MVSHGTIHNHAKQSSAAAPRTPRCAAGANFKMVWARALPKMFGTTTTNNPAAVSSHFCELQEAQQSFEQNRQPTILMSSVAFSIATALSVLRRLALRARHSSKAAAEADAMPRLLSGARPALVRTPVAVALQVNPVTPHHHTVWYTPNASLSARPSTAGDEHKDGLAAISAGERVAFLYAVREAQLLLAAKTGCTDFNLSWQEGRGHPVPGGFSSWARYVHIVPRLAGDLEGDAVHELLEKWTWAAHVPAPPARPWPADANRVNRTPEVLAAEAARFRRHMQQQPRAAGHDADAPVFSPQPFTFGRIPIPAEQLFFESATRSTVAFVNLRPLRPSHVLVCPRRVALRVADLTAAEYEDLMLSARAVAIALEEGEGHHRGFIFAVQDGPLANQSIPHVHVHLIPRG